jgi:hypothetical protein
MVSPSVAKAAEASGIPERTIRHWLREDEDFARAYRYVRKEIRSLVVLKLMQLETAAIEALHRAMTCGDRNVELRTATFLITHNSEHHCA